MEVFDGRREGPHPGVELVRLSPVATVNDEAALFGWMVRVWHLDEAILSEMSAPCPPVL